jgi:adenylate cyclase
MRVRDIAVAAVMVALAAGLSLSRPLAVLDGLSIDYLFFLRATLLGPRHAAESSPTVIVAIDEETYRTPPFADLPQVLWTPELARVLRAVMAADPKVVGLDIILPTSAETFIPGFDRDFLLALHEAAATGRMVLGKVQHESLPIHPYPGQSYAVGNERNIKSTNLFAEPDEVVRRAPLLLEAEDPAGGPRKESSFPLELAARAASVAVTEKAGKILFGDRPIAGSGRDAMLVDFDAGAAIPIYSLADLRACAAADKQDFFASRFKDRVVLIGSVLDLEDRKLTSKRLITGAAPLASDRCVLPARPDLLRRDLVRETIPGVFIQAAAINTLLRDSAPTEAGPALRLAASAGLAALASLLLLSLPIFWGALGLAALLAVWVVAATLAFGAGLLLPLLPAMAAALFCGAALALYRIAIADRDRRRLRHIFGLYVAPSVVAQLAAAPLLPELGGERREMSFLFTDIADFTRLSEQTEPHRLARIVNDYLEGVCATIMAEGGMVDEIMGDGVLAFFGAPLAMQDHARRAIAAAERIDLFAERFRLDCRAQGLDFGHTRIGIHAGSALVGNFGSAKRMKYAALGDAVNTGARIEGLNKYFSTRIAVSEPALAGSDPWRFRPLGEFLLRGKTTPLAIHELLPAGDARSAYMESYRVAFAQLRAGEPASRALFEALAAERPADGPVQFHLARLRAGVLGTLIRMEEK